MRGTFSSQSDVMPSLDIEPASAQVIMFFITREVRTRLHQCRKATRQAPFPAALVRTPISARRSSAWWKMEKQYRRGPVTIYVNMRNNSKTHLKATLRPPYGMGSPPHIQILSVNAFDLIPATIIDIDLCSGKRTSKYHLHRV